MGQQVRRCTTYRCTSWFSADVNLRFCALLELLVFGFVLGITESIELLLIERIAQLSRIICVVGVGD